MARNYEIDNFGTKFATKRHNIITFTIALTLAALFLATTGIAKSLHPISLVLICGIFPCLAIFYAAFTLSHSNWIETEREKESERRDGKPVLGMPPKRKAFEDALNECQKQGKSMIDRYLVGFELDSGEPIWAVSYTHLRAHETREDLVCRLLLEKKK